MPFDSPPRGVPKSDRILTAAAFKKVAEAWVGVVGTGRRCGMMDLRLLVLEQDAYRCVLCKAAVTNGTAQVDHLRPVCSFKRPVDANRLDNLQTLCIPCHAWKTEFDRQRESRVP